MLKHCGAKQVVFLSILLLGHLPVQAQNPPPPPPPPSFPIPPRPVENPHSEPKRVLGKILFWDEQLSSTNTVSCGTCHVASVGGQDPRLDINPGVDLAFDTDDDIIGSAGVVHLDGDQEAVDDPSSGFSPQVTERSAPSIFMAAFSRENFWDGRALPQFIDPEDEITELIADRGSLESQAVGPIVSSIEMAHTGRTWDDVRTKLTESIPLLLASNIPADMQEALDADPSYPELFEAAFGDTEINAGRIAFAIATYERTLIPDQTPWDLYMAGDNSAMTSGQVEG